MTNQAAISGLPGQHHSRHSSMDEHATRAMSGAMSSLSLSLGGGAANPLGDGGSLLSPKAAAFMEASSKSSCSAEVAATPARLDSGEEDELMLCFTESGCVLRESASFTGEVCFKDTLATHAVLSLVHLMRPPAAAWSGSISTLKKL